MFNGGDNKTPDLESSRCTEQGQVDGLRGPRGEDQIIGKAVQPVGHGLPSTPQTFGSG